MQFCTVFSEVSFFEDNPTLHPGLRRDYLRMRPEFSKFEHPNLDCFMSYAATSISLKYKKLTIGFVQIHISPQPDGVNL